MVSAKLPARITFVYKRASRPFRAAAPCPLYKQRCEASEFLFGNGDFSLAGTLDRFPARAQDRSYTNNTPGGLKQGMAGRPRAGLFMTTDATMAAGGDKIRCHACPVMCYIKP